MSSVNRDIFTSSFQIWMLFISFSCLISLARTSSRMLIEVTRVGHPCFVPECKTFSLSTLSVTLTLYFSWIFKIRFRKFPSFLVEVFSLCPFNIMEDCSVQFRCSVVSDCLQPHEPQHTRPPCPSPTPEAYPNSCPLSRWCHLTISSSVIPFSCLQSFPTSGSFQMSQFFALGGQNIRVSASTLVLPMNT